MRQLWRRFRLPFSWSFPNLGLWMGLQASPSLLWRGNSSGGACEGRKCSSPRLVWNISEEAVLKARVNAEAAGITIHYINRDVRDFRHEASPSTRSVSDLPLTGRGRNPLELTEALQRSL